MPQDVNTGSASSVEEQRPESESLADNSTDLTPEHEQYLADPKLNAVLKNLTGAADDSAKADEISEEPPGDDNQNPEDEETVDDPAKDGDETKDDSAGDEPVEGDEGADEAKKAAAKAKAESANDTSDPDPKEVASFTPGAQKRIQQLVKRSKAAERERDDAKTKAAYREELDARLTEAGMTREAWDDWVKLGFAIQTNPKAAAKVLGSLAQGLGYAPADPKAPVELDADLKQLVSDDEMTEAAAKKVQATRQPRQPAPAQPREQAPREIAVPSLTPRKESGEQIMLRLDAEYGKKYPDQWDQLAVEVNDELKKYRGTPLPLWEQTIRDAVGRVMARKKTRVAPPDPVTRGSSGGRSTTTQQGNKPPTKEAVVANLSFIKRR